MLYGITGSGKTEIYIKLIEHYINEGKSCLILVPEIGLTPLMISRIISYFSEDLVGILHSSLTNNERYDEYRKIKNGKTRIVVGTRSAIFAPLKNIDLFNQVYIDYGVPVWNDGDIDIAPEKVYRDGIPCDNQKGA